MILLPRHRLYRQPQGAAEVDWGNPLTRGLVLADTGGLFEAVSRSRMTNVGASRLPSPRGMVYSFASSTRVETSVDNVGPPFTVAFDVRRTGTWGLFGTGMVSHGGSAAGGKGWQVGGSSSRFRITFGGVAAYSTSTGELPLNEWVRVTVVVTGNGGSAIYYIDGAQDSSRAVGTMGTPVSRPISFGAAHNGSGWTDSLGLCDLSNVSVWNRALSADEVAAEVRNPAQIFRPLTRRLYVQVGGGASTSYGAASLTGAGTLAASGIRIAVGAAALSGAGTLAATGLRTAFASASLTGSGTLAAAGVRTAFGSVSLAGDGTLTASGTAGAITRYGAAAFTGAGTLTAAGVREALAAASLTGTGTLSASGTTGAITRYGSVTLTAEGTLSAVGLRTAYGAATLTGVGTLSVTIGQPVRTRASLLMSTADPTPGDGVRFLARSLKGEAGVKVNITYGDGDPAGLRSS